MGRAPERSGRARPRPRRHPAALPKRAVRGRRARYRPGFAGDLQGGAFARDVQGDDDDNYHLELLANGQTTPIPHAKVTGAGLVPVALSADGTHLAANDIAGQGEDTSFAYTIDIPTGATGALDPGHPQVRVTGISQNGARVLVDYGTLGKPLIDDRVLTFPFGGGRPTTLATHTWAPSWNQ